MFGPKSYLHGGGFAGINNKGPIVYFDIRVSSPYRDLILIKESQLETEEQLLSGKLILSINENFVLKKLSLKLVGRFKLDFLQLDHGSGVTNIVKDRKVVFETNWDNLLVSSHGEVVRSNKTSLNHPMRSFSSPVVNRLIKKKSTTSHVLELPSDGFNGTPFTDLNPEHSYLFHLHKGNYELPFDVRLPQDIPDTIEGLQSGSILYSFEAIIDRPQKIHFHSHGFSTYKYLRIFRTLAMDHLALQQDVTVSNTYVDKLQYKISIPSKAIAIGGSTVINIELFPFRKGYKLEKITGSLKQWFVIRDTNDNLYDDQIVINKQSMTEFKDIENIQQRDNLLLGNTTINSIFQLPHDLKKITQDVECANDLIHVKHKISIHVMLRHIHDNKTLEIKANLPVLLYVSPAERVQGRLVLLDSTNGNIHFRTNEYVDLFDPSATNSHSSITPNTHSLSPSPSPAAMLLPPPNYMDRLKDSLVNGNRSVTRSAPVSPRLTHQDQHPPRHQDKEIDFFGLPQPAATPVQLQNETQFRALGTASPTARQPAEPALPLPPAISELSEDERCQVPSYEQTMQEYPH